MVLGKKYKNVYQIGDRVYVKVKDACKETRTVDFEVDGPKERGVRKGGGNKTLSKVKKELVN